MAEFDDWGVGDQILQRAASPGGGGAPLRLTVRPQSATPAPDENWGMDDEPVDTRGDVSAGNVGLALARGIPVLGEYLDEGEAAVRATFGEGGDWSSRYDKQLGERRQENEAFDEKNPALSTGLKLAGGVVSTLPLGLTGVGAKLLGMAPELGLGANLWRGAVSGGGIGTAGGFGAGEGGLENRAQSAVQGGVTGAAIGGAVPVAAAGVGSAVSGVRGAIANRAPANVAAQRITSAAERDAIPVDQVGQQVGQMGRDATLADLGPNLTQQAARIAAEPGPGQQVVRRAFEERGKEAGERVTRDLDAVLGVRKNVSELADDIVARRSRDATPLYEAARAKPLQVTPEIQSVLDTPAGKFAVARASRLSQNEGIQFAPDVRGLDLVKRTLDDAIEVGKRQGKNNETRVLAQLRDKLVSAVDQQVPEYATARQVFSSASQVKDALETGQSIFKSATSPDDLARAIDGMSAAEHEALITGARSALAQVMGTARNDAAKARSLFQQGWNAEKLEVILGPDAAQQLLKRVGIEETFARTSQRVSGNSETAARVAARDEAAGTGGMGVTDAFKAGGAMGAVRAAGLKLVDKALGAVQKGRQAEIDSAMAEMLTARGIDRQAVVKRLVAEAMRRDRSGVIARHVRNQANLLLRSGTAPLAQESAVAR